jgi:hypothetical protein
MRLEHAQAEQSAVYAKSASTSRGQPMPTIEYIRIEKRRLSPWEAM